MHACFDCIHINVFKKKCEIAACIINLRGLYGNLTGYNNKIKITWCLELNWISAGLPAGLLGLKVQTLVGPTLRRSSNN